MNILKYYEQYLASFSRQEFNYSVYGKSSNMDTRPGTNRTISIDVVTKVVDNFGDAGVALRFLRALTACKDNLSLRLFIDKPSVLEQLLAGQWTFHESGTELLIQDHDGNVVKKSRVMVYDWEMMPAQSSAGKPDLLIELFGAGLPERYMSAVCNESGQSTKNALWLNLEHLTAESWAIDYHKTASYSPYPGFDRYFFMPGFTPGLGGLIIDSSFLAQKKKWDDFDQKAKSIGRLDLLKNWEIDFTEGIEDNFWISIFSYQKDFSTLIDQIGENKNITVLLCPGKAVENFLACRKDKGNLFSFVELPFLAQTEWDKLLLACDINLVRGEESLSRAALSGRPFLWQAYPLADQEHLDKVAAFCDILCQSRIDLKELFLQYNRNSTITDSYKEDFMLLWRDYKNLKLLFRRFSINLLKNGDCAQNVMLFFKK